MPDDADHAPPLAAAPAAAPPQPAARVLALLPREPRRGRRARRHRRRSCCVAIFADVLAPHSPDSRTVPRLRSKPPVWQDGGSWRYPLGTDARPRHALAPDLRRAPLAVHRPRRWWSSRSSSASCSAWSPASSAARSRSSIMRLMDIILPLPSLLLAIVIVAILGPGPDQRDARGRHRLPAALRAPHPRRGDRPSCRRTMSPPRASRGAGTLRLMFSDGAAELPGAADRAGDARHLDRHPRRRGARLPRPRRAAADAGMGHDAGRCARVHPARLVGRDLPGPRHPDHRARLQPARRRPARRARSRS